MITTLKQALNDVYDTQLFIIIYTLTLMNENSKRSFVYRRFLNEYWFTHHRVQRVYDFTTHKQGIPFSLNCCIKGTKGEMIELRKDYIIFSRASNVCLRTNVVVAAWNYYRPLSKVDRINQRVQSVQNYICYSIETLDQISSRLITWAESEITTIMVFLCGVAH